MVLIAYSCRYMLLETFNMSEVLEPFDFVIQRKNIAKNPGNLVPENFFIVSK